MEEEIKTLEQNETWDVCELPSGKKSIGCRWVYKIKLKLDGTIDRFKARLVAKANQIEGIDFRDSFSLVAKIVIVRVVFAVVIAKS